MIRRQRHLRRAVLLRRLATALMCVVATLAVCGGARSGEGLDATAFRADAEALTKHPHRLTGTPEGDEAADYVLQRLREMGIERTVEQVFSFPQTRVNECEIELTSPAAGRTRRLPLTPMRPNGVVPPATPAEGLSGPVVYARKGEPDHFEGDEADGAIVVLDYDCDDAWRRAFRYGAKAVIFVDGETLGTADSALSTPVNANLPRYLYAGDPADLQSGGRGTVRCSMGWERTEGRNILALIRGTRPIFRLEKEEVVVLAARLDSFGEAPRASPGARGALNCAALLQLAARLQANPPRRHVLIAFLSGEGRGHAGASALYRAFETGTGAPPELIEERATSLARERAYIGAMKSLLDDRNPFPPSGADVGPRDEQEERTDIRARLRDILDDRAENHARLVKIGLSELRRAKHPLLERKVEIRRLLDGGAPDEGDPQPPAELRAERAQIDEKIAAYDEQIKALEAEEKGWNDLRRALADERVVFEEHAERLPVVMREARETVLAREAEIALEDRALESDRDVLRLAGDMWISLHLDFEFGDGVSRWGLVAGDDSDFHSENDNPGQYKSLQNGVRRTIEMLRDDPDRAAPERFETASVTGTLSPARLLLARPYFTHSGVMAGKLGIFNMMATSVQAPLRYEGSPRDTLDNLPVDSIAGQTADMLRLIPAFLDSEDLSTRNAPKPNAAFFVPVFTEKNRPGEPRALGKPYLGSLYNKPMGGAVIQAFHDTYTSPAKVVVHIPGFENYETILTDANGCYAYGPVPRKTQNSAAIKGFAARFDERGQVSWASNRQSSDNTFHQRLNMFECRAGWAKVIPDPKLKGTARVRIYNARATSALEAVTSYSGTLDGLAHWYVERKITGVKLFEVGQAVAVRNGPARLRDVAREFENDEEYGEGFSLEGGWRPPLITRRSAVDLWRLDEARIQVQRERGVTNASIEELHGRVEDLVIEAQESLPRDRAYADALYISSIWGEEPVYTHARSSLDDLVKAVLVLLALSVPFAFALERLLIGATTIYHQILGFVVMFTLTFLALYFSHPAFAISNAPLIIFLGFAIITLTTMVIVIIMRKFEVELKVLQGLTSTVHAADVSRFSTVVAAMNMGISTMRRRPVRTALTALTIILLTFTILCFASFDKQIGVIRMFRGLSPQYTGVFLHDVNWAEFHHEMVDLIRGRWGEKDVAVCPRYWVAPNKEREHGVLATRSDGSNPVEMRGLLGLRPEEVRRRADLGRVLSAETLADDGVYLTRASMERLGVAEGDGILIGGLRLRVGRPVDDVQLGAIQDLNGKSILPVDFMADAQDDGRQAVEEVSAETALTMEESHTYLPVDSIAIVSAESARRMGASIRSISAYTVDRDQAVRIAEELTRTQPFPVHATREDGVYIHALGPVLAASGAKDLVFPILLGGLVVFGTMLGSVTDREKEIYTFSALGLAPPHVASLFFAEALVYSVIGGLGGYLLAQMTLEVLTYLATFGWVSVPEMNYSSTNAIITILIVMLTVLVSAVYPAVKASRSANPGILRTWRLPAPEGDRFRIAFPFTVSEYDITGVVSFLKEHFDNYRDVGLGVFMARDPRLLQLEDGMVGLRAELALAPFDLGVNQSFELRSRPSDIPGIDEVHIDIQRLSGQPGDWARLNKTLLDDLRRQFLIWRSLPQETMEIYRQRTLTTLQGGEAAGATPQAGGDGDADADGGTAADAAADESGTE